MNAFMHTIAHLIATYSVDHGWIEDDECFICCYAFERRLTLALFFVIQLLIYVPAGKIPEAFIYVVVVLSFRSRMGGIHANNIWICQAISTGSVLFSVFFLGPCVEQFHPILIILLNIAITLTSLFLKPSYPPQVCFSHHDKNGNIKRKNLMLFVLLLMQVLSARSLGMLFTIYSSIGLLFVNITVILGKQYYKRKDDTYNEGIEERFT